MRRKKAHQYSDEEFQQVVALLKGDEQARADIEAITGRSLSGMTNREIFDLYLAVEHGTDVKIAFARYAQAGAVLAASRHGLEDAKHMQKELEQAKEFNHELVEQNKNLQRTLKDQYTKTNNAIAHNSRAIHSEGTR